MFDVSIGVQRLLGCTWLACPITACTSLGLYLVFPSEGDVPIEMALNKIQSSNNQYLTDYCRKKSEYHALQLSCTKRVFFVLVSACATPRHANDGEIGAYTTIAILMRQMVFFQDHCSSSFGLLLFFLLRVGHFLNYFPRVS